MNISQTSAPIQDGGPAFPTPPNEFKQQDKGWEDHAPGMSLRDYFAAAALQSFLASLAGDAAMGGFIKAKEADGLRAEDAIAINAFEIADAMLKAREKQ